MTEEHVTAAALFVGQMQIARPAADKQFISDRCSSLLAHFFSAATGDKLNAIIAADWMVMLSPFPAKVIHEAARRWMETSTYKPKPAEIRNLCIDFYGRKEWHELERATIISKMQPSARAKNPATEAPAEEWQKPDETKKRAVAAILHGAGQPHDREFCTACREAAQ